MVELIVYFGGGAVHLVGKYASQYNVGKNESFAMSVKAKTVRTLAFGRAQEVEPLQPLGVLVEIR